MIQQHATAQKARRVLTREGGRSFATVARNRTIALRALTFAVTVACYGSAAAQQSGVVQTLVLIDARTGQTISEIGNGSIFSTNRIPSFDVQAITKPANVGSVVFLVNGERRTVDASPPYTLGGGTGFSAIDLPEGQVIISAIPYSLSGAEGVEGMSLTTTIFASPRGTGEGGKDDSDFNSEGEAVTEAESEAVVEAVRGIAAGALAQGASAAASGNNAVAQTGTSASLSISTNATGAQASSENLTAGSTSEENRMPSGSTMMSTFDPPQLQIDQGGSSGGIEGPTTITTLSAEAEAEAEAESEVEVGVGPGSAIASAGASAAAAAVGANTYLRQDELVQPIALDTQTAIDVGSSTSTSVAGITLNESQPMSPSTYGDPVASPGDSFVLESASRVGDQGRAPDNTITSITSPDVVDSAVQMSTGLLREARSATSSPFDIDITAGKSVTVEAVSDNRRSVPLPDADIGEEDLVLTFSGIDIQSQKELDIVVNGRIVGSVSTLGDMPSMVFLERFQPTGDSPPIPVQMVIPAGALNGDATEIGFRHWAQEDSWDVVDMRLLTRSQYVNADGSIFAPGANGTEVTNVNVQALLNPDGSTVNTNDGDLDQAPNRGSDISLPDDVVFQLDAEVESEVESEVEAEVATGPAAAAAGATGVSVSSVAGDFAATAAWNALATSTSTSDVTMMTPPVFLRQPVQISPSSDAEITLSRRSLESPALVGMGTNEAEAEAVGQVGAETSVGNNSAAAAAVGSGGAGASGVGATSRVSAAASASTSTASNNGDLVRLNDEVATSTDRFAGSVDFLGKLAEAEADTEADLGSQLKLDSDNVEAGSPTVTNTVSGDAQSESAVQLSGFGSAFLADDQQGTRSMPARQSAERPIGTDSDELSMGNGITGSPGNLEVEVESEATAEVEVDIGFNSAASAASAAGVQAENGYLMTPAEAASATATSTSVFDNPPNVVNMRDLPGPAPAGERGGFPRPSVQAAGLIFEVETEAEADAEVGFEAGAAAAAASSSGKRDIQADTQVASSYYAAAAASASGAVVLIEVSIPPTGEAGPVIATARAEDPACNGVAVAVAVAGVSSVSGERNESSMESEDLCVAIVEVEIFTDPGTVMRPHLLDTAAGSMIPTGGNMRNPAAMQNGSENEPEPFDSTLESEGEAEATVEAEAGYGVAGAAAASASSGLFSTADAKTSTSSRAYNGGYNF